MDTPTRFYANKKLVFDQIRTKEPAIMDMIELSWRVKWAHWIAGGLETIERGIKINEARKSKWDRIGKPILKVLYSILMIVGRFCTPKL